MQSWKSLILTAAVCALGIGTTQARATVITFDNDPIGFKPNNWQSVDSSMVSFSDTSQTSQLAVWKFLENNYNPALVVNPDDGSKLRMDFSSPVSSLSLAFGNDDPSILTTANYAILTAYNGNTLVAENDMHVNANDVVDQTLSISGAGPITRAEFYFANADKTPAMLTEIVDNVSFSAVPEPSSLALLLPGAAMLLRRRK